MNLFLDIYAPTLSPGCCPSNVGVVIFNEQHQALREVITDTWQLDSYTKATHDDFVIRLNEHTERVFYYHKNLDSSQFTLPKTPLGEYYYMEYWYTTAEPFDREIDTLLEHRKFIWSGKEIVDSRLDVTQENDMAIYKSHAAIGYDSDNQTVSVLSWIERNGKFITNPKQCKVEWLDRNGNEILNVTHSTYLTNLPGVFSFNVPLIDLTPDESTPVKVSITDIDDNVHETMQSVITWD